MLVLIYLKIISIIAPIFCGFLALIGVIMLAIAIIDIYIKRYTKGYILKEKDFDDRKQEYAFTTPQIVYDEMQIKKNRGSAYKSFPLVVYGGDTNEVRNAVYCARKAGLDVYGMYQEDWLPGYDFYMGSDQWGTKRILRQL